MKKTLLIAVATVAMCLFSCNNTDTQSNKQVSGSATEQVESTSSGNTAAAGTQIPDGLTGDIEKDADILAKATLDMSAKMTNGKDNNADAKKVQQLMDAARDYYSKQGKTEEFAKLVNDKMTAGITELAKQLSK